jgi:hypothetical protein
MKKYLILLITITILTIAYSTTTKQPVKTNYEVSTKDEINSSIIEGFYNNDTVGISKSIYLLK